jgi:cysteine desulfuration protein SufE
VSKELDQLIDDFSLLDDWEERYRYVIELGRTLPEMDDHLKTTATKVSGCASQVWIHSRPRPSTDSIKLDLMGDSDALIVKGLIAIAFMMFAPLTVGEIVAFDAVATLRQLGLHEHLTPQRSNGFASMIFRIKADAQAALVAE